ncbi:MAG TPA: four helix bundle protein, partial [Bacteroidota bacterium]|nr:four helix bundle protein [Bacteroidota bacterium]
MQDFKRLKVWGKAHALTLDIYLISKRFPKDELFGLTSQLRRASFSIGANIAEGCGRISKKEFLHFLSYAIGSASEVEYFLILVRDLQYISIEEFNAFEDRANEIKRTLISFMRKIENS